MTETLQTRTFDLPGTAIAYDVRGDLDAPGTWPPLLLIGYPMDATGFTSLAPHFSDRVVVTYDPRGTGRSPREAGDDRLLGPDDHAEDLRALVDELDVHRVDLFASSGGAVNGLAFVARYPELVRTFVSHEPPLSAALPDAEVIDRVSDDIAATYTAQGLGAAMAKFIALISYEGELGADYLDQPAPDPTAFGLPTEDDGSRDDPMLGGSIRTTPRYRVDVEALRRASTRVVIGVGEESGQTMAARGARATAAQLGLEPVVFPGDHGGFLGGEFGMVGKPVEFAERLREVLDGH